MRLALDNELRKEVEAELLKRGWLLSWDEIADYYRNLEGREETEDK